MNREVGDVSIPMSYPGSPIDGSLAFEFLTHDSPNPPDRCGNNRNHRSNILKEIIESNNKERKQNVDPHKNAHSRTNHV